MASLFSKKRKQHPPAPAPAPADSSESSTTVATSATDAIYVPTSTSRLAPTFTSLGIPAPLTKALSTLSIRTPSPVQLTTIPPILSGSSLIAIASTGSGKTLAFLLPILTRLALDPYGIYAVIMSPTRELAGQINDQLLAVGSVYNVRSVLITGGGDLTRQSCSLASLPHFIVATPGRLASSLKGSDPPPLKGVRFIVLDEADRLLTTQQSSGFEADVHFIISSICGTRHNVQMLLYSATITDKLEVMVEALKGVCGVTRFEKILVGGGKEEKKKEKGEKKAAKDDDGDGDDSGSSAVSDGSSDASSDSAGDSDAEAETAPKIPSGLKQEYIYMPHAMRDVYLVTAIRNLVVNGGVRPEVGRDEYDKSGWDLTKRDEDDDIHDGGLARSAIVFCGSCERSAHLEGTFRELGVDCVALHSLLSQDRRNAALGKFKSQQVKILIATDIASRGLDVPEVDLVVNAELPRKAQDYIHRVGRTARAGRRGLAVSLVGEEDVSLIHAAEKLSGRDLVKCERVKDRDCLKIMSSVAKASRLTKVKLMEIGFKELVKKHEDRKNKAKKARAKLDKALSKGGKGSSKKKQKV